MPERSRVWIDARSTLHAVHSTTDGLGGFIDLEAGADGEIALATPPAGRLSLPVSRLSSGNVLQDRELRKRIDARRFPTIDGVLDGVSRVGGTNRYLVSGELTFLGVARRCEDEVRLEVLDDGAVQLEGASRFDVRDFGLEPPRVLVLRVEPEVVVRIEVVAERAPGS